MKFEKCTWYVQSLNDVRAFNDACEQLEKFGDSDFVDQIFLNGFISDERFSFGYRGGFIYACRLEFCYNGDIRVRGRAYLVGEKHVKTVEFDVNINDFSGGIYEVTELI